jgi:hypothetical protein
MINKSYLLIIFVYYSFSFSAIQSSWHFGFSYPFSLNLGFQSLYTGGIPWLQTLARADFQYFPYVIYKKDTIQIASFALTPGMAVSIPLNDKMSLIPKLGMNVGLLFPISETSEPLDISFGTYMGAEMIINNNIFLGLSFYNLFSSLLLARWVSVELGFPIRR